VGEIPTVKVKNPDAPGEFMIINQRDFQEGVHELFDAPGKPAGGGGAKAKGKGDKGDSKSEPQQPANDGKPETADPLDSVKFATPEAKAAAEAAGLTAEHFKDEVAESDAGFTEVEVAEIAEFVAGEQK